MRLALKKSPISGSQAFVVKDLKDSYFDPNWHFHTEYQLFVVLEGAGTRFVGDHVSPFSRGDMVFTGPNLPHLWRSDDMYFEGNPGLSTRGVVIYFHEHFPGDAFMQKEEMMKVKQLFAKSLRGLEISGNTAAQVSQMMLSLLQMEGFDSVIYLLKILNVLTNSSEIKVLSSAGYTNTMKEGDTERMNLVHAYVMKNFRKKIRINQVAALANMTPTSFCRYFRIHANKTFSEFLSEIRIGYACKLLIEGRMNVSQACYECGFQTLSNFNKQFKTITHCTPLQYKKKYLY